MLREYWQHIKDYANAIAHLILGTEEIIKFIVFFLDGSGFELRHVKDYRKLFYYHKSRHFIIKDFFSVWIFALEVLELTERKRRGPAWMQAIEIVAVISRSILKGYANHEWWNKADELKQECFYVDYDLKVKTPANIIENDFLDAAQHVKAFYKQIKRLVFIISVASKEDLQEFRKTFEVKKYKGKT